MTRRLYKLPDNAPVLIRPAITLADADRRAEIIAALNNDDPRRVFVYFQDKLGGEIGLPGTAASPNLSFDITVIELLPAVPAWKLGPALRVGRYGVIELQTTDTHGSYKHAVDALAGALNLHNERPGEFAEEVAAHPDWSGRQVEGPNISNVFKRTFYQINFKFQVTKGDNAAGCILAIPKPVWDSWQPFLGAPELRPQPDGTWRLLDDHEASPTDWIYVFDIDEEPGPEGGPAPLQVRLIIGTDAQTLAKAAFDIAPARAIEYGATDAVITTINRRLRSYLPGTDIRS
jgi:hypothetical protein